MKRNYTAHIAAGILGFMLLGGYVYLDNKYTLYEAQQAALNEPPAEPKEEIGKWNVHESKSPIDDKVTTTASVRSVYYDPPRERATMLMVQCFNHELKFYVIFDRAFFFDLGGEKSQLTFRLGSEPAFSKEAVISTSNDALFVAEKDVMDVVQSLYGQNELLVAANGFNGTQLITRFPIKYAENALKPVLRACRVDLTNNQEGR